MGASIERVYYIRIKVKCSKINKLLTNHFLVAYSRHWYVPRAQNRHAHVDFATPREFESLLLWMKTDLCLASRLLGASIERVYYIRTIGN